MGCCCGRCDYFGTRLGIHFQPLRELDFGELTRGEIIENKVPILFGRGHSQVVHQPEGHRNYHSRSLVPIDKRMIAGNPVGCRQSGQRGVFIRIGQQIKGTR